MKYLIGLLKAAIFFALFAFALNNQHEATVYFFFGTHWRTPLILVLLAAFACGLVIGALGMVPGWWKHRTAATRAPDKASHATAALSATAPSSTNDLPPSHPHGL